MGIFKSIKKGIGAGFAGLAPFALSKLMGGDNESNLEGFQIPTFEEDPDYRETQNYLKDLGIDILGGDIPDYYKGIGEAGGAEFENMLSLLKGDIQSATEASFAATGRSGGVVGSVVAEKTGRLATEARYNDFLRSLEGKGFLFQQGRGITEGVRAAGQAQQAQVNAFSLDRSGLDLNKRLGLDQQDAAEGEAFGKMLEMGLGAAAGYLTGGPVGAVVGAAGGFDYTDLLKKDEVSKTKTLQAGEKIDMGNIKKYPKLNVPKYRPA